MLRIMEKNAGCEDCRFKSESTSGLKQEELEKLENDTVSVSVKRGEKMMVEGFQCSHVIYIKKGFAKLHKEGPTGKDQILKIATPCTYIGIQSLLADQVNNYSATAIDNVEACYISGPVFRELINGSGQFASIILALICKEELDYFNDFVNLQQKNNRGRLADALIFFSEHLYRKKDFIIPFSNVDLAALIGTTRESVNRIMREFSNSKLIRYERRSISILNMDMLKKNSEMG